AQHQTADPRPVGERRSVCPFLDERRGDVVVPTAPVVPGDEDHGVGPEPTLDDRIDLLRGPVLAILDRLDGMLTHPGWSVEPGNGGKLSSRGIGCELRRLAVVLTSLQRRDVAL